MVVLALGCARAPVTTAQGRPPNAQVFIQGGAYLMGDKKVTVTVGDFYLDKTEVTVAAYRACVAEGKCPPARTPNRRCNADKAERATHPINCVNWHEAKNYCEKNGGRLPTEAEWEWAARGRDEGRAYPWGNEAPAGQLCFAGAGNALAQQKRSSTCPVASYPTGQSRDGLFDMAGNVAEWTSSAKEGDPAWRVVRGGAWIFSKASDMRVDAPDSLDAALETTGLGFRCARTP